MIVDIVRFMTDQFNITLDLCFELRIQFIPVRSQVIMIVFICIQRSVFF